MFVVSHANRRLKTICDMPTTTQKIVHYSLCNRVGLVNIYCKLHGITLSHNKTHLDPCENLFFHAKAAGVHTHTHTPHTHTPPHPPHTHTPTRTKTDLHPDSIESPSDRYS